MDRKSRTIAKALTWQTIGFVMMTLLGYLATSSFQAATGLAVTSFIIGTGTYVLHERVWSRIAWGRKD